MNYWNGTCDISNLPILKNESVILIPLYKVSEHMVTNCCYPADNFAPFAFPIIGEYNDQGGLYNIEILNENKEHLLRQNYYFIRESGKYDACSPYEDFEDFVNEVLCCQSGVYIDVPCSAFHVGNRMEIGFMMIHFDLYRSLVEEMSSRIPHGQIDTYGELLRQQNKKKMQECRCNYETLASLQEASDRQTSSYAELAKNYLCDYLSDNIFRFEGSPCVNCWRPLCEILMSSSDAENNILNSVVELTVFTTALSYMRKGYLCDSGFGSQAEETHLHVVLAQFILKQARKDCDTSLGVRDSIYWYEPIS